MTETDIARQLQITDIEGNEVIYTQTRDGNVTREYLNGSKPTIIIGYLIPDAKADSDVQYQQHIRFKGMIATIEWGESYSLACHNKRFAEYPLPTLKPKTVTLQPYRHGKHSR